MNYFFHPAARIELLEQIAWYEAQRSGLGAKFLTAFVATMNRICEAPERHRVEFPPNIRRYRVPGFRFKVLYREVDAAIEVLAVAAHRRRPSYWLGRVSASADRDR